jgi:hypothetical protein
MADCNIAAARSFDKPTFIYGLVDPRTKELRYIGKTVLSPDRRLSTHLWRAEAQPEKRHSMAWLLGLKRAGIRPEVFVIEEIAPGIDWVEAEQFWIAYFRMIGADLCNHTVGGEGVPGLKRSAASIAKMMKSLPRGERHYRFGKSMQPHVAEALAEGARKLRSDPVRSELARQARLSGMTPERMAPSIAALKRANADPETRSLIRSKSDAKFRSPGSRQRVSRQSLARWATNRDELIAAQNAAKGEVWRQKQSVSKKAAWKVPGNKMALATTARRKLTDDDLREARRRIGAGETQGSIANELGVHQSSLSEALKLRKF